MDALNLWTRLQDRELERGQAQFGIPKEEPPAITFSHNVWRSVHFDTTYEKVIDVASSVAAIKKVLALYRTQRHRMVRRTVLKDGLGVRWDGGDQPVLFAFKPAPATPGARDAATGEPAASLSPNHAYLLKGTS